MGHGHPHHHHAHPEQAAGGDLPTALDTSVPDSELSPADLSRRGFLRNAGLLGAGAAATVLATPGLAHANDDDDQGRQRTGGFQWLAGDHHIHTQYSSDAMYRVVDQARHARANGLDWMVVTDHGSETHAKIGVEKVNPDIVAARRQLKDLLVYQGLEWNIPAAEHGTVFVSPGRNEVAVLKEFENAYDGAVRNASDPTPANEALAIAGIKFLGEAVRRRRVDGALFLANHPARRGVDSPHEIRGWRDADPSVAIGMEGAPGHQAAGIPKPEGAGGGRGYYEGSPSAASFPGYPLESYRTWGGFDWMTSTVGGLWDSLLAEGRAWWITANSDSHVNYLDTAMRGPGSDFAANGRYNDPVHGPLLTTAGDFWPGQYSRTHVGADSFDYRAVMDGLRAGRVWVDHGGLISGLDVRARVAGDRRPNSGTPLGGVLQVRRGTAVELTIDIDLAATPNWSQFVPVLARVDVIAGAVTGPVADGDTFTAPNTRVVKSFEVNKGSGRVSFTYSFGKVAEPFYVRLRGTDGNRAAPGLMGAGVDPFGPAMDVMGAADPWTDLWFYANPIWVLPQ
ncbi:PHP domain-containing protein [Micromonospora narathiwatensis]|uniref:Tat (Twin-arginine translocation) pathway signal sequence n=1 Tax=Micromonospora narathiwatensis TaxID=299146 RepID=A0A1A8ZGQ5_9ACTN|nr:PHP domain-containing protein [Micromonospora narathiwatensis]SBT43057.1 Tat (twin-arginine translocation) pathway signal sequence [Micromonospora narathiwatensis]